MLNQIYVDNIIKNALLEDINYIDCATDYLIPDEQSDTASFLAKADGVLCGINIAKRVFQILQPDTEFHIFIHDGEKVKYGDIIATVKCKTKNLLKGERTALNLLQHLSGIATETAKCVELVKGTKASIADTRKTIPGIRSLQKYAVTVGGGRNHRYNLSDAAMLKDNHIDAGGGITNAVSKLRSKLGHMTKIEVMLDNMSPELMSEAVKITDGKAVLEASGGITSDTIRAVAESGVDIISLGAITHSVRAFDISLKIAK